MKESPILFSTPMVQAIINGQKIQTRRVFKGNPRLASDISKVNLKQWYADFPDLILRHSPYGKPADLMYVRETWQPGGFEDDFGAFRINYKAGGSISGYFEDEDKEIRYADMIAAEVEKKGIKIDDEGRFSGDGCPLAFRPGIHMWKEFARIWLQITDISVERLQEINEEDAIAEGIWLDHSVLPHAYTVDGMPHWNKARDCFQDLWSGINGPDSWQSNPWVWIISFKVISTTGYEN